MRTLLVSLSDALSFLTILPFPCPWIGGNPALRMCRAFVWFPLVGIAIGGVGGGVVLLAARWYSVPVASFLGLVVMVGLTGGLHLDGFSDTVDGLAAWNGSVRETLQVMRDSRIGALGALALMLLVGLKWVLIQALPIEKVVAVLAVTCSLSRLMVVFAAQSFPYVPGESGLGKLATDKRSPAVVVFALIIGGGVAIISFGIVGGLTLLALALTLMWSSNQLFLARLGGITGDTLGAVNEVTEVGLLLALAM